MIAKCTFSTATWISSPKIVCHERKASDFFKTYSQWRKDIKEVVTKNNSRILMENVTYLVPSVEENLKMQLSTRLRK